MTKCVVCDHPRRLEIESAILSMSGTEQGLDIGEVAKAFEVDETALKTHALFHTPLVSVEDLAPEVEKSENRRSSLTRMAKLREVDMLAEVSNEYLLTLKTVGRRIKSMVGVNPAATEGEEDDNNIRTAKVLTKPVVDLYIGLGGEIRSTVKTMSDIERALNGPQDSTATGLEALANAIRGSGTQ